MNTLRWLPHTHVYRKSRVTVTRTRVCLGRHHSHQEVLHVGVQVTCDFHPINLILHKMNFAFATLLEPVGVVVKA